MVQIQLINSVMVWEKRLELNEERLKYNRSDPYVNYLAAPQIRQNESQFRKTDEAPADFLKALNPNL